MHNASAGRGFVSRSTYHAWWVDFQEEFSYSEKKRRRFSYSEKKKIHEKIENLGFGEWEERPTAGRIVSRGTEGEDRGAGERAGS
jgi:hypothetical protein